MATYVKNIRVALALSSFLLAFFSSTASADTLDRRIQALLESSGLSKSRHSIQIVSLPDGRVLYQKNPDLRLNPASNIKLVTMAAALHELGPSYTFKMEFRSDGLIDRTGTLRRMWIKGFGDPAFVTEELDALVRLFKTAGLKRIEGDILVDDTYFDRNNLTTYIADADEKLYKVSTGPLSFNFNAIVGKAGKRGRDVKIRGVPDPALYTGNMIKEALQRAGVKITGKVRREAVPETALLVLTHRSPPLREILRALGKFSNNFTAEQIIKTISAERLGPPGSTRRGLELLRGYLVSLGIGPRDFVLDNGSGLTLLSQMSASQFIRLLSDLYASPWRDDFVGTLSIAGVDGTMARKLTGARLKGHVFAKTGTLNNVSALSGYVFDPKRRLAFSFIFNEHNSALETIAKVEEEILEAVLDSL